MAITTTQFTDLIIRQNAKEVLLLGKYDFRQLAKRMGVTEKELRRIAKRQTKFSRTD